MNVFIESYSALFERDLEKAKLEVSLYKEDSDLWKVQGEISNSGGNLILHITGNLRHFIGHILGESNYQRKRKQEFTSKDIPRDELIIGLQLAIDELKETFVNLSEAQLQETYPLEVLGYEMTTAYFISHLYGHLTYHLGQVNYHRRLVS